MPIYEYECKDCGKVFEKIQPARAKKKGLPCPKCNGKETERIMSCFSSGSRTKTQTACPPAG